MFRLLPSLLIYTRHTLIIISPCLSTRLCILCNLKYVLPVKPEAERICSSWFASHMFHTYVYSTPPNSPRGLGPLLGERWLGEKASKAEIVCKSDRKPVLAMLPNPGGPQECGPLAGGKTGGSGTLRRKSSQLEP